MKQGMESESLLKQFCMPGAEHRGVPLWSWNGALDRDTLLSQIDQLKQMGFGGIHIHSRIGLQAEYMGKEFLDMVKICHDYANQKGMSTWLYDEDKWPSGTAGGKVTQDAQLACRYLLFSPHLYEDGPLERNLAQTSRLTSDGMVRRIASYRVCLRHGKLDAYARAADLSSAQDILAIPAENLDTCESQWYAYLVVTKALPWFNNAPYVDTLNPKATERFLQLVHEPYAALLGGAFAHSVPAIFTDEPCVCPAQTLARAQLPQDVGIPYTDDWELFFAKRYGFSFLDRLPELFWDTAAQPDAEIQRGAYAKAVANVRYCYYDCLAELFSTAYCEVLAGWCEDKGIALTGHMLGESLLDTQTRFLGEVMRGLRVFQLPGIDMLANRHEYTTAKQAQSVARQGGRKGVMCEIYGVTNWDFDFRGHKHQGDWLAALGVTARVPHLAWLTMAGEAKRDYPAPIDGHSPWYRKYPNIEDYFARLNVALKRGTPCVRIGVVHPIESFWMCMGPDATAAQQRAEREAQFAQLTQWLLFSALDFDFIAESSVPELHHATKDKQFHIGSMSYDVIVIPCLLTLRSTTCEALEQFVHNGGKLVFAGDVPAHVNAVQSSRCHALALSAQCIDLNPWSLCAALEPYRDVAFWNTSNVRVDHMLYQMRYEDDGTRWLFVAHGKQDDTKHCNLWATHDDQEIISIVINGCYEVAQWNALTGKITRLVAYVGQGKTTVVQGMYAHDSLLLRLIPCEESVQASVSLQVPQDSHSTCQSQYLRTVCRYTQDEPNVMLLDQAQYCLDEGIWCEAQELLKIDTDLRVQCGYPQRNDNLPQPWAKKPCAPEHLLTLRFRVNSEVCVPAVWTSIEPNVTRICWNGADCALVPRGSFVDAALVCYTLGALLQGENILELTIPFGEDTALEWCYLLGDFGVKVLSESVTIVSKPTRLAFADIGLQGFPFYGGCITYISEITTPMCDLVVEIPEFSAPLIAVSLDGGPEQDVFLAPYKACFLKVPAGAHTLSFTVYGSRINTFGQVHDCNRKEEYYGPQSWRTTGKNWSYAYQLKPAGILVSPLLHIYTASAQGTETVEQKENGLA